MSDKTGCDDSLISYSLKSVLFQSFINVSNFEFFVTVYRFFATFLFLEQIATNSELSKF